MEKKIIQEAEEQLKRALLMMKYVTSKTLSENIINERDAVVGRSGDIESLVSILTKAGFKIESGKSDPDYIPSNSSLVIKKINTNKGEFNFFQFKPGGYWRQQNFVVQKMSGKSRIGTFDVDSEKLYMKVWETPKQKLYADEGFNEIIGVSDLKPLNSKPNKCKEGEVYNKKTQNCEPAKKTGSGSSQYTLCDNPPFKLYCKNDTYIKPVQRCLDIKDDGYLGPKTQTALEKVGVDLPLNQAGIDKACKSSQSVTPTPPVQPTPEQKYGTSGEVKTVGDSSGQTGVQTIDVNIKDIE